MTQLKPVLKSSPIVKRYEQNPILSAKDIPYSADLIFNAGITKFRGRYVMIFRNDYGYKQGSGNKFEGTNLGLAFSDDGVRWQVSEKPFVSLGQIRTNEIQRIYDPRLTVIEDELFICFAMDTAHGIRGGIGRINPGLTELDIISLSTPDNRNMVLFPEKVNDMYIRLERPFPVYGRGGSDRFDLWISKSPDLVYWGESELVIGVEDVPYANDKIGPAAPPVKTEKGWLTVFHTVDIDRTRGKNGWEEKWQKRYCAGVMLLDLENPQKVLGICKSPLIAPEAAYETDGGFRNHVIFPGGMILEDNGEVKIYYGAADTVECLATANLDELIGLCLGK